jgi:Domain of Unknown Function (DUF1206).
MSRPVKKWFTVIGTVGHVARAVVFGLVGIFLVKASIDYKANEAIGLDGALAKLYDGAYGSWLLGCRRGPHRLRSLLRHGSALPAHLDDRRRHTSLRSHAEKPRTLMTRVHASAT